MQIHKQIKDHGRYDRSLKRQVARRYLAGEFTYRVAAEEYGLRDGSLDYLTPSEAYDMTGEQVKRWRKAGSVDKTTRSRTALDAVNLLQVETNNVNCQPVDDF